MNTREIIVKLHEMAEDVDVARQKDKRRWNACDRLQSAREELESIGTEAFRSKGIVISVIDEVGIQRAIGSSSEVRTFLMGEGYTNSAAKRLISDTIARGQIVDGGWLIKRVNTTGLVWATIDLHIHITGV